MSKLTNWVESKLFWLKTGDTLVFPNDGKPTEQIIIKYKDIYFEIDIDVETQDPTGEYGWSRSATMTHVPIRDFYTARRKQR